MAAVGSTRADVAFDDVASVGPTFTDVANVGPTFADVSLADVAEALH